MFYVGQKVVCVETREHATWPDCATPSKGAIYTIRAIRRDRDSAPYFHLVEIVNSVRDSADGVGEPYYKHDRFRPIIERKTDISFAHEILRKATKRKTVKEPFPSDAWNG